MNSGSRQQNQEVTHKMEGNYPPKISLAAARVNAGFQQDLAAVKLKVNAAELGNRKDIADL